MIENRELPPPWTSAVKNFLLVLNHMHAFFVLAAISSFPPSPRGRAHLNSSWDAKLPSSRLAPR